MKYNKLYTRYFQICMEVFTLYYCINFMKYTKIMKFVLQAYRERVAGIRTEIVEIK